MTTNSSVSEPATDLASDLVYLAQLASGEKYQDVRLFLGKLIRKYRTLDPVLAGKLNDVLGTSQVRSADNSILRRESRAMSASELPVDGDTQLDLIRIVDTSQEMAAPILPKEIGTQVEAIIREHAHRSKLEALQISPTRSALLVGPPGVGKTFTAQWIAHSLGKPLWVLDLAAVMSSLLGKTGANLRAALDHAKANDAVLLLDEIDAIAKRRADTTDVGELKRLVAVILQEVDQWPDTSLLLGATNHPELLDPALWRRFDAVLKFDMPHREALEAAITRFLGKDHDPMRPLANLLTRKFLGQSISDVRRSISSMKRNAVFENKPIHSLIEQEIGECTAQMTAAERIEYATYLAKTSDESYHNIHRKTGVSRDTIRKHAGFSKNTRRGRK